MTRLDKIFIASGLLLASVPFAMAALLFPQFRETFVSFGAELPFLTRILLDYPVAALVLPASVGLVALAWPNKQQRGLFSLLLGLLYAVTGTIVIILAAYLPVWKLGAVI